MLNAMNNNFMKDFNASRLSLDFPDCPLPGMKTSTNKQLQRLENKRKKIAAFLEIAKLNDHDREVKESKDWCLPPTPSNSSVGDCIGSSDGEDKMPHDGERKNKRIKTHHEPDTDNIGSQVVEGTVDTETPPTSEQSNNCGPSGKQCLLGENFAQLRSELRNRKKLLKKNPIFRLRTEGEQASVDLGENDRTPLFFSDIQHLLLYSLIGNQAPYNPFAWCSFEKFNRVSHTVVLMVEGLSLYDFLAYQSCFPSLTDIFKSKLEVIMPSAYNGSIAEELALVPLTHSKEETMIRRYGSLEAALRADGDVYRLMRAVFPVLENKTNDGSSKHKHSMDSVNQSMTSSQFNKVSLSESQASVKNKEVVPRDLDSDEPSKYVALAHNDRFPRTHLIMSPSQLLAENFPIPLKGPLKEKFKDYILTKDLYKEVTPFSPMFGLDCEMCMTSAGILELTRISVVDEEMQCIYDCLVKPHNAITNYLTRYSGITPNMLQGVAKRLGDVQCDLRKLLPMDAILIGQSLNCDLHTLKMMHPYVIDTSVIYNLTSDTRRKTKLSKLALKFLGWEIQTGGNAGHCSTEDSMACMKLVQLKLANSLVFGDAMLASHSRTQPNVDTATYLISTELANDDETGRANSNPIPVLCSDQTPPKSTGLTPNPKRAQPKPTQEPKRPRIVHYAKTLFSYLKLNKKAVGIVSTGKILEEYSQWIKNPRERLVSAKRVSVMDNANVFNRTIEVSSKHSFTIGHARYNVQDVVESADDVKEAIFREVDDSCKEVWDSMLPNSLCVVVFGGRKNGANGVSFIQLKTGPIGPIQTT